MDCTLVWHHFAEALHLVLSMHTSVADIHYIGQTELATKIQDLAGALQHQGI